MTDCKIWRLERKGFKGIRNYLDTLIKDHSARYFNEGGNLLKPEEVNFCIVNLKVDNSYKQSFIEAYGRRILIA